MKPKDLITLALIALGLGTHLPLEAVPIGVSGSSGVGAAHIIPYRMAILWDLGPFAWQARPWQWRGVWELSTAYWDGEPARGRSIDNLGLMTTGPQFRLQRNQAFQMGIQPYLEGGIGASWLSEKEVGGRRLGMHYQFEDRIGLGMRFGSKQRYDVNIRAMHYSNASLGKYNSGINLFLFTLGYWN